MSYYKQGLGVGAEPQQRPNVVIVEREAARDTFWTAVKWIGAAITLAVGYREAKGLYRKYWGEEEAAAEIEGED